MPVFSHNFYSEDRSDEKRDILTGRVIEDSLQSK